EHPLLTIIQTHNNYHHSSTPTNQPTNLPTSPTTAIKMKYATVATALFAAVLASPTPPCEPSRDPSWGPTWTPESQMVIINNYTFKSNGGDMEAHFDMHVDTATDIHCDMGLTRDIPSMVYPCSDGVHRAGFIKSPNITDATPGLALYNAIDTAVGKQYLGPGPQVKCGYSSGNDMYCTQTTEFIAWLN
ncbi:hypothetical protein IAQ61_009533, partial [Plenodomus lingam]